MLTLHRTRPIKNQELDGPNGHILSRGSVYRPTRWKDSFAQDERHQDRGACRENVRRRP